LSSFSLESLDKGFPQLSQPKADPASGRLGPERQLRCRLDEPRPGRKPGRRFRAALR